MPSVLAVDDSSLDRRLVIGILEKQGDFKVEGAARGAHALSVMARELPDIVVTDLQMPDKDGLDLVRAVRSQYPLVPVVLMTAHGSEEIAVESAPAGRRQLRTQLSRQTDLQVLRAMFSRAAGDVVEPDPVSAK